VDTIHCPNCGQQATGDAICSNWGHAAKNGTVSPSQRLREKPPGEMAGWVIQPIPPEIAEEFRRTFNEEEYLADLREIEATGGVKFEDFIEELERAASEHA
jgi:hypothetical protein